MGIPILVRHLNMDRGPRLHIHKAHKPCVHIMGTTNLGRLNCCKPLQWRHNERDGISHPLSLDCLFNFCLGADQRKHQSSASLAPVRGIHRWPVDSLTKYGWPKWTKSAKGSTYEKFHVRKHTRIKSFVYKTIRVSKVSCIKWYAYQKFRV